ncbi:MAG: hypothetical protein Q7U09_01050 [Hydrogenophaga sp.]|uniref:hypothetical protein n=1 Tax=Hydrogenophaga sp. TaxID=1904254 RepID=UPI00272291EB|nr:hypothetical protein [Hydrogenophaga sp.]MDO9029887.1 hypothetical protein [Hydrogenophaga sp.]MDO9290131.1 hypothetical protein [Hydrogenophaga sp.]
MPPLLSFHGGARSCTLALTTAIALGLSACGGGSDDDSTDGGAGGTAPSASIEALTGDWVQKGCVKTGGQSFRKFLRAHRTAGAEIDYHEGVLTYGGSECAGASQLAGPSRLGSVSFSRSEANARVAAHWGEFRTVTGTRFGAIWTLKPGDLLCLLGDEIPTNQPSLSAVSASLASVPEANCFTH